MGIENDVIAGSVSPVEIFKQWSAPATVAVSAGKAVYRQATTGWAVPCGSANAAEGIAITTTTYAGQTITAVQQGRIDLGGSALTPYNFGATIYVGDAAGTAPGQIGTAPTSGGTWAIGKIVPVFASHSGSSGGTLSVDRLLDVDL